MWWRHLSHVYVTHVWESCGGGGGYIDTNRRGDQSYYIKYIGRSNAVHANCCMHVCANACCCYCSLSLWRVVPGIKLTYLASRIHGLFITWTQFRLSTTFISGNYHTHIYRLVIIRTITRNYYVHAYEWTMYYGAASCFLLFPFPIPFCLPFTSLYLLGTLLAVIGSRPPWSQVARKLISPFLSPPHSLPIPKSRPPGVSQLNVRLIKTTSQNWLISPEQLHYWIYIL